MDCPGDGALLVEYRTGNPLVMRLQGLENLVLSSIELYFYFARTKLPRWLSVKGFKDAGVQIV